MVKSVTCSPLIGSRLDYANSVVYGMSSTNVARLQRAQIAAARVVVWGSRRPPVNSYSRLEQLRWLPINCRITFKIACFTYKTVTTAQPTYLHSVLGHCIPSRRLSSSDCSLLCVPRVRTCFGSRGFSLAAPTIWNSLPLCIRSSPSLLSFRRQLKTFFHKLAFEGI